MAYASRHHLTDVALEDLLELINCHTPVPVNDSLFKFLKNFPAVVDPKLYFLCPNKCHNIIKFPNGRFTSCPSCKKMLVMNDLKKNGHYFVRISFKDQLIQKLSGPLFWKLNRNPSSDHLSNVVSGKIHKELKTVGIIGDYDITLQFSADGVQTA